MAVERLCTPGDLVPYLLNPHFNTVSAIIRNPTAGVQSLYNIVGMPVVLGTNGAGYNLMVAGGEANVLGLILSGPPGGSAESVAATTNSKFPYQVLKQGPVVVNRDKISLVDIAGAALNVTSIVTALLALNKDFDFRTEPVKKTTL